MPHLSAFFENVQLPTMPDVARELIATMHDDDIPFEKVRNAIARDPALTAKLIRLANSARFGLPRSVSSLDDAITMVGLNQVRTLALAACTVGLFKDAAGLDATAFWKESMATAGYAQWLARTLGTDVPQSWLAGFLVRLGEFVIAQKAPEQIPEIERLPHHAGGRWEREQALLGFTEAQVTAELARRWNFPEGIVRALDTAGDPLAATPFCRLGAILHVATLLAEIGLEEPMSASETVRALPADLLSALQLDPAWVETHLPPVEGFVDALIR
ncbi:HDOD domain-containing protein [Acidovorax sp. GBBC 3334]|uniref:HDOD domain-containing protein n=1 Tax=Acidovorax sp. GBBC 3334 TaxID=2940496 RepID=UPI0023025ACA|nr:HDOD domain-containing protein [Acidovorax sp. GBBC 3334]MDA8454483.1 HDOD domain-containing protein [Acidovorax sp. GBBC 3334]